MEWYLSDHLGSTSLMVDENGLEVERTDYFPYGQVRSGGLEKYGFTGQENNADTGLMYYGARYYSPGYGIFVQPDTLLPDPYNPQALNRYAYALNNPVKYTDSSGHYVETAIDLAFLAMDINDIRIGKADKWTYIGLTTDVACLALPGVTGGRLGVQALEETVTHADNVGDLFKLLDKTAGVEKKVDNVADIGKSGNKVDNFVDYGHSFGKMGTYVKNPSLKVDWDKTTLHGAERMEERGISKEMIETWVKDGKALSQDNGNRYAFVTTDGVAVINKDGKLITAWKQDTYDEQMKNVVNKLYGEVNVV